MRCQMQESRFDLKRDGYILLLARVFGPISFWQHVAPKSLHMSGRAECFPWLCSRPLWAFESTRWHTSLYSIFGCHLCPVGESKLWIIQHYKTRLMCTSSGKPQRRDICDARCRNLDSPLSGMALPSSLARGQRNRYEIMLQTRVLRTSSRKLIQARESFSWLNGTMEAIALENEKVAHLRLQRHEVWINPYALYPWAYPWSYFSRHSRLLISIGTAVEHCKPPVA
jgi:hypothetical protein